MNEQDLENQRKCNDVLLTITEKVHAYLKKELGNAIAGNPSIVSIPLPEAIVLILSNLATNLIHATLREENKEKRQEVIEAFSSHLKTLIDEGWRQTEGLDETEGVE